MMSKPKSMHWDYIRAAMNGGMSVENIAALGVDPGQIKIALNAEAKESPVGRVPTKEQMDALYQGQRYEDVTFRDRPIRPAGQMVRV
jgi:hypothetical protein